MKPSITSYIARRMWQVANHPEWTPDVGDLVYACHGTGSDRDRVFTLQEVLNLVQVAFTIITMQKSDVTLTIEGNKIHFVKSSAGGNITTDVTEAGVEVGVASVGKILYGPSKISVYANDGTTVLGELTFDRDNGERTFNVTKGIGFGSKKWRIINGSYDELIVQRYASDEWSNVAFVKADGSVISLKTELNIENWSLKQGNAGSFVLSRKIGDTDTVKASFGFNADGSNSLEGDLAVNGFVSSKNTILATSDIDLTSSPYSGYAAGTTLTIINDKSSGAVTVTYGDGTVTESVPQSGFRTYAKNSTKWCRQFAKDNSV